MNELSTNTEYKEWLQELKLKIKSRQIKAALSVNSELIKLYWEIGAMIVEKQRESKWGSGFVKQLSADLKKEFPKVNGFSETNLKYCRRFYLFYNQTDKKFQQLVGKLKEKSQQAVDQIPWGHNILIFTKSQTIEEALFYVI